MAQIASLFFLLSMLLAAQDPLRVMSYNVRYPNPEDGQNAWPARRELFIDSIRAHRPDLIGTQELFQIQGDAIVQALPEYTWFGTSRRGNSEDEHMGVFYRTQRLRLIRQGQFWLSETPDTPGSQSWHMTLPRMVTWGLFEDRVSKRRFYLLNTHFPHRREDDEARRRCVQVIGARLPKDAPILLTGDFNAPAGGPVHAALRRLGLEDSRQLAERAEGPEGTFHGFGGQPGSQRIDWIFVSPGWKVRRNETLTFSRDGRYPSDHFPILVEVEPPQ